MTRHVWKDATEDVHQQWYDPILAEILPSYRLANTYIVKDQGKTVNRKLAKDSLRYPRYMFYEPVLISGKDEISKRANHFKIRLSSSYRGWHHNRQVTMWGSIFAPQCQGEITN